ncbi:MAG: hypothetical protein ACPGWR_26535, partial [Ardenticatenaceae bacterium]
YGFNGLILNPYSLSRLILFLLVDDFYLVVGGEMPFRFRHSIFILVSLSLFSALLTVAFSFDADLASGSRAANEPLASHKSGATELYLPLVFNRYPPPPTIFGTQTNSYIVSSLITPMIDGNFSWIRYDDLFWSEVEAVQAQRDWTKLERFEREVSLLSGAGRIPLVVVRGTPSWAQQKPPYVCGPIREDALDDFADFMRELVERYSRPPYNVTYWEIWNEPDVDSTFVGHNSLFGCWGDDSDPYYGGRYFAEMLKKVYPAMKEANPNVQIVMGGLLLVCDPTDPPVGRDCHEAHFLEGVLQNGGGDYFDMLAFHGYAFWWPNGSADWDKADLLWGHRGGLVLGKADFLREVLARYDLTKPIMQTEGALVCHESVCPSLCHETDPECPPDEFFAAQANYALRAYTRTWANGLKSYLWYQLHYNGYWRYTNLLDNRNNPRPAYTTIQFMSSLLSGATYVGPLSTEHIEGYQFENPQTNTTYQLYWTNEMAISDTLPLPANTHALYDKLGEQITPNGNSITISFEPIFIEIRE